MPQCLWALLLWGFAFATAGAAVPASGPAPRDTPYPGTITLHVDASDVERRLFRVRETIPVRPGALTLYFPEWLPGNHAPRGPIDALAGLTITANGRRLEWVRDPLDVYAFRLQVPAGVQTLELEFQYASPQSDAQGRIVATPEIVGVQWEKMLLYPAGHYASRITMQASLTLPAGWQYAIALDTERRDGDTIHFRPTSLETLVDSPLFAGLHFARHDLDPGAQVPVRLNIVADGPEELEATPEQLAPHRRLVQEAYRVFGRGHFDRYEFLLSISDNFSRIGLEHLRSSENGVNRGYFTNWEGHAPRRDLLPHEMVHSWNGKFRRPADLWTPHYNVPMQDTLLWVYEGQTEYWGFVLSARSGLWSEEFARAALASDAALYSEKRQGREWRNLLDTTHQPIITPRRPLSWVSWQRTEDYYTEGLLLWLDVDAKIRELTQERRSLDDFAQAFFGIRSDVVPATYTFRDVVSALDSVAAFDWAGFLRERLGRSGPDLKTETGTPVPLEGLERAGWRLVFTDEPSEFTRRNESLNDNTDLSYSLGVVVGRDGRLAEVVWESPAFEAGLSTSTSLVAVNGIAYTADRLKQAIRDAPARKEPIELLVRNLDRYRTVRIEYTGGLRYPHLERIEGAQDRLSAILKGRT